MAILKKHSQLFVSFTFLGIVIVLACAGGDWDGTEGSMFTPEIINSKKYEPFFRTAESPYYGENYFTSHNTVCNDINVAEWESFLEKKVSTSALNYWLYNAPLKEIGSMLNIVKGKKGELSDSSQMLSLANIHPADKISAFLFYLGFAKRNEQFAVNTFDYWEEEKEKSAAPFSAEQQIEGGLKLFSNAKSDFMRERYVFQLTRLYFFNRQHKEAIDFYTANATKFKSENSMKWRAMGYAAASYYQLKDYANANYLYSLIYDKFDPHKKIAYFSFHPKNDYDWEKCMQLAQNVREKTVLWHLFGLYYEPARAIREIHKLDPASDLLDVLITRAVNIEEEKRGWDLTSYKEKDNSAFTVKPDPSLVTLTNEIALANKTFNLTVWDLAAAYLNYSAENFSDGDKFLKEAQKSASQNELMNGQYQLISLYGKLARDKKPNVNTEKNILAELNVLFADTRTPALRYSYAQRWTKNVLAVQYARNKEFEKAEMIQPGTIPGRFAEAQNVRKMISYFDNSDKTELEKFFIQRASLKKDDYLDLLAIRFAQAEQLDSAVVIFTKMTGKSSELLGNPFNIRIRDCHDCDHEAKQKIKYTKLSFIEKIIEMKKKAETNKESAAQNYFLIANGFYNMTHFGNARVFYSNNVMYDTYYFGWESESFVAGKEFDCSTALKYYLLAAENSTDKEFKAKCMFMASKCELNTWYMNKPKKYEGDFKSGKYFRMLKEEYSDTRYYSEIIKECSYFRTFTGN